MTVPSASAGTARTGGAPTPSGGTRARPRRSGPGVGVLVCAGVALVLAAAIALDTTVVRIGSDEAAGPVAFSPQRFGETEFPRIKGLIEERAVDAATLAAALTADKAAATAQYGVAAGGASVFPVKFTGTFGEAKAGNYTVAVPGLPEGQAVRVQTGPAINGTELRDATGTIEFGQFTNQIEYQDAGSALNNAMKAAVLAGLDTKALAGKTVTVVGAFRLVNPKNWLVTPVSMSVQ